MKKLIIVAASAVVVLGAGMAIVAANNSHTQNVSDQTITNESSYTIAQTAVVYDVRTTEEYATGHVATAINWPVESMQAGTMPTVAKDTQIYVYCKSGRRAGIAKQELEKAGFTNVTNMGGVNDVAKYGLTITTQ